MNGIGRHVHSTIVLNRSAPFPFVIPSVAEGSAVPRTIPGNVLRKSVAQSKDLWFNSMSVGNGLESLRLTLPYRVVLALAGARVEYSEGAILVHR
jgi:hypothetical protein